MNADQDRAKSRSRFAQQPPPRSSSHQMAEFFGEFFGVGNGVGDFSANEVTIAVAKTVHGDGDRAWSYCQLHREPVVLPIGRGIGQQIDRKSTRLNSSH